MLSSGRYQYRCMYTELDMQGMEKFRLKHEVVVAVLATVICIVPLSHMIWHSAWGAVGGVGRLTKLQIAGAQQPSQTRVAELQELLERSWSAQAQKEEIIKEKVRELAEMDKLLQEKTRQADSQQQKDDGLADKDRRIHDLENAKQNAEHQYNALLHELKDRLYDDSIVMRQYIQANFSQLQAAWQAKLAGQRQRGVVMSAGGSRSVPIINTFASLYVLRNHVKCNLPIAVIYWGAEEAVDEKVMTFFKEHLSDLEFIDGSKLPYPSLHRPLHFSGFIMKTFALYAAPFKEVLFLDSDSMPVLDPTPLFEIDQYKQNGNLFWPDFWEENHKTGNVLPKRLYEALKLENPWASPDSQARQSEAGQFLFDRERNWDVLEWLLWLNTHTEVVYKLVHGDKDTFRAAFFLTGDTSRFQQVEHYPAEQIAGKKMKGIMHLHPNGTVMFNHRNPRKYKLDLPPWPTTTHITARASADLANAWLWRYDVRDEQAFYVKLTDCEYTLYDLPAAERACAPSYNINGRGLGQRLPLFEVPEGSFVLTAEAAGNEAFLMIQRFLKE